MDIVDKPTWDWFDDIVSVEPILSASNSVYQISLLDGKEFVFKPSLGERPLWDFEHGKLWLREYFAFLLLTHSNVLVPRTYLVTDGPLGSGLMIQKVSHNPFDIVQIVPDEVLEEANWLKAIQGYDNQDRLVKLLHADNAELRRIALLDVVINNADRKVSHILKSDEGYYAIDHGLSFHTDEKLRTFLWGWADSPLHADEINLLSQLLDRLEELDPGRYIDTNEIVGLKSRIDNLLQAGIFPALPNERYPLPSPIF